MLNEGGKKVAPVDYGLTESDADTEDGAGAVGVDLVLDLPVGLQGEEVDGGMSCEATSRRRTNSAMPPRMRGWRGLSRELGFKRVEMDETGKS